MKGSQVGHRVEWIPGDPKALVQAVPGGCGVREVLFNPRFCPTCGAKLPEGKVSR